MANIKSAKKRILTSEKRRVINKNRVSRIRSFMKKVELAIKSGNQSNANAALKELQPELDRGVAKGVVHKNYVARTMSRLNARIKKIAA